MTIRANGILSCTECTDQATCEICDAESPGICKRCKSPFVLFEGKCVGDCPPDFKDNTERSACIPRTINDLGILPFPFLIAAFFGCLIVIFGTCKKKFVKRQWTSTQNTITCFIVILAFIQFLAMIALLIWALLFGTSLLFFAGCILLGLLMMLNFVFQVVYSFSFNRTITPEDKLRKYKEYLRIGSSDRTINRSELKKYQYPVDSKFVAFAQKHSCWSLTVAILTFTCTYKFNKTYYSHFYMFDIFKAHWHRLKYYRKMITCFGIISMIIDGLIICVCVAALLTMEAFSNMLWITTLEVAVLSFLLIIFGCIELFRLKTYLKYVEDADNAESETKALYSGSKGRGVRFNASSGNDFMDKDSREVMMTKLLRNVKQNQDMFLNNKLDDLLNLFGDRRCKSMIDLGTGWDKEDDPRLCHTWPLSPSKAAEFDGDYKFTQADMIGGFEDNVYAEVKVKDPVYDIAVQGD